MIFEVNKEERVMKYTSPIYENEMVETTDIMEESIVSIAYVNKTFFENGNQVTKKATQITVDVSNLF